MKIINDLKAKIDSNRAKMEKSYATKNEVREESNKLSQAVGNHYLSVSNFADFTNFLVNLKILFQNKCFGILPSKYNPLNIGDGPC